jgi:1,4-alpha-glucan branching enzyme
MLADVRPAPASARRLPVGAEPRRDGSVAVRLWAPDHGRVGLVMDGVEWAMRADVGGYFTAVAPGHAGSRYAFRLDGVGGLVPDPASR